MKYKVFEMKNGLITFTKEELANLLEEVYNEGRASVIPLIDLPPKKSNPITAPTQGKKHREYSISLSFHSNCGIGILE